MPEGPELHMASLYVNKMCKGLIFTGAVRKSEVSKSPDVSFTCEAYRITATSRGKEVKLTLTPMKSDDLKRRPKAGQADRPMNIVFRFGMSGYFRLTSEDELPKHSHLRFYSNEKPSRVLSFVDARRFGGWQPGGMWQPSRGPCVITEYKSFRENILSQLSDRAFDRPICEVLLNQKYFNGIGNYLRAEILFRLNIPPFVPARTVLEVLESEDVCENKTPVKAEATDTKTSGGNKNARVKEEKADLLRLCHTIPLEVVKLGVTFYNPEKADYSDFEAWLQCYYVDGMKSVRDHNGRTMWFKGDPGPMVPKGSICKHNTAMAENMRIVNVLKVMLELTDSKTPKVKKRAKKDDHDYTVKKKVARSRSANTTKEKVIKQEPVIKSAGSGKDAHIKQAASKRRKMEINTPQNENKSTARRRKNSSAVLADAGPLRRSARAAKQSGK